MIHCWNRKAVILCCILLGITVIGAAGCANSASAEQNGQTLSFVYMSDIQADPEAGGYEAFGKLLEKALAQPSAPQLLVLGGDTVNDGSSAEEWDAFWAATKGRLEGITVAAAAGNHDNQPLLKKQFDFPKEPDGFYYTFTDGNVFFCMMDSNAMGGGHAADAAWLEEQLASEEAKAADWRILVCHHPFFPVVEVPKDIQRAQTMRDVFLPVMQAGGVDLVLCGHQHLYARAQQDGMEQLMAASGAKESYVPGGMAYIKTTVGAPNYLIVEASGETLTATAYDSDGAQADELRIGKEH